MDPVVQAAAQGSLSSFALALSGVVITALIAVVVWLTRDRIKARERFDATLEKRLQAGSGRMERFDLALQDLQLKVGDLRSNQVNRDQCASCKTDLKASIDRVAQSSSEVQAAILRLDGRLDEGLHQVSRLLSGLVQIPRGKEGDRDADS